MEDNIEKQRLATMAQDSAAQAHHGPDASAKEDGTQTLRLDALVQDRALQARKGLHGPTVNTYARNYLEGAVFPPIKVALVDGLPVVVDGWHRVAARKALGEWSIVAEVVKATKAEAMLTAMLANLTHGLPLKKGERIAAAKRALGAYISARMHLKRPGEARSLREIAEALGGQVSHNTVRKWLWKFHRKTAERYWGHDPFPINVADNTGPRLNAVSAVNTCANSIENALAAFQGVVTDEAKAALITMMEDALAKMKTGQKLVVAVEDNNDF
ncbi:MAG: hypothetical protein HY794_13810 [Desulfarculus sp.]|nr:hypothetical protein [Desulfarculus sp.]